MCSLNQIMGTYGQSKRERQMRDARTHIFTHIGTHRVWSVQNICAWTQLIQKHSCSSFGFVNVCMYVCETETERERVIVSEWMTHKLDKNSIRLTTGIYDDNDNEG